MIVIKKLIHCKYIKNITIKTLYNTKRFYIDIYNFKMIFPINKLRLCIFVANKSTAF